MPRRVLVPPRGLDEYRSTHCATQYCVLLGWQVCPTLECELFGNEGRLWASLCSSADMMVPTRQHLTPLGYLNTCACQ